ncbi:MAG TPA: hypothetical protein VM370_05695 [Candidatus Thermoplasmatota archaeon]|nr:hypothetical protein [Candidatus Thermoplasmatota archaeon]
MKLLLASLVVLGIMVGAPLASADTNICQPSPAANTCVRVIPDDGWAYTEACTSSGSTFACAGGGHWDYSPTPYVGNGAGLEGCSNGVCAAAVGGQESYFGAFDGYGGVGGWTPAGSALVAGRAGTYEGAPFREVWLCVSTIATGGTCLAV